VESPPIVSLRWTSKRRIRSIIYLWRWDCSRLYSPMLIDMYGHRWDTDKWCCFLCSEQQVHAFGDDVRLLRFYPALLAWREYQQYKCLASPCDPLLMFPVGQRDFYSMLLECCLQTIAEMFVLSANDLRPSFNSPYSTRRDSRFSDIRMTRPVHLSWCSAMMASIERQWARRRISTWGTLSNQRSLIIRWRQEMWNCLRVLTWRRYRTQATQP